MTPTPSTGGEARADLLERLKAATGSDRELDAALYNAFVEDGGRIAFRVSNWSRGPAPRLSRYHDGWLSGKSEDDVHADDLARYTSSLDDALALVERTLPGWHVMNLCEWDDERLRVKGPWMAQIKKRGAPPLADLGDCRHAPTAPLALLIALLSALPADSLGQEETGK